MAFVIGDFMNSYELIYEVVKKIPYSKVATYGQIALLAGNKKWARVVGYAIHKNPKPSDIKCYRVVNKDGFVAKSFAFGGEEAQIELLKSEGVTFTEYGKVDLKKHLWNGK